MGWRDRPSVTDRVTDEPQAATTVAACPDPERHFQVLVDGQLRGAAAEEIETQLNAMYVKGYRPVQSFMPDNSTAFATIYEHHFH